MLNEHPAFGRLRAPFVVSALIPPERRHKLRVAEAAKAVADCYSLAMSTIPTRIDEGLFEAARAAGALYSRSAAQQLAHWARLGRELEASPSVTHDAIARVLAGQAVYDDLPDPAQAVVRVEWDDRVAATLAELDFTKGLHTAGEPWAEADEDGNLVRRDAAPPAV